MADKQHRILCIEDEENIRELIVSELTFEGYEVLQAADGQSGLEMIVSEKPDLVLCDICMPKMPGYEVLSTLRNTHKELDRIPFIFLSALTSSFDFELGYKVGADDYLTKPVDYSELLGKISASLRQVERLESLHRSNMADAKNDPAPSTATLVKHVVGDFLQYLQLVQLEAVEKNTLNEDSQASMNQLVQFTASKLKEISALENMVEENYSHMHVSQ